MRSKKLLGQLALVVLSLSSCQTEEKAGWAPKIYIFQGDSLVRGGDRLLCTTTAVKDFICVSKPDFVHLVDVCQDSNKTWWKFWD